MTNSEHELEFTFAKNTADDKYGVIGLWSGLEGEFGLTGSVTFKYWYSQGKSGGRKSGEHVLHYLLHLPVLVVICVTQAARETEGYELCA